MRIMLDHLDIGVEVGAPSPRNDEPDAASVEVHLPSLDDHDYPGATIPYYLRERELQDEPEQNMPEIFNAEQDGAGLLSDDEDDELFEPVELGDSMDQDNDSGVDSPSPGAWSPIVEEAEEPIIHVSSEDLVEKSSKSISVDQNDKPHYFIQENSSNGVAIDVTGDSQFFILDGWMIEVGPYEESSEEIFLTGQEGQDDAWKMDEEMAAGPYQDFPDYADRVIELDEQDAGEGDEQMAEEVGQVSPDGFVLSNDLLDAGVATQVAASAGQEVLPPFVGDWTVENVRAWLKNGDFSDEVADTMMAQEVDGQALLMLQLSNLTGELKMDVGTAASLIHEVNQLRRCVNLESINEPTGYDYPAMEWPYDEESDE